jgi:hypothetical protein
MFTFSQNTVHFTQFRSLARSLDGVCPCPRVRRARGWLLASQRNRYHFIDTYLECKFGSDCEIDNLLPLLL